MSQRHENRELRQYDDIIAGLEVLGRRIDSVGFPGLAWAGPRRFRRLVIAISAAGALAAAVVLLVFTLHRPTPAPLPAGPDVARVPAAPLACPATASFSFAMPTTLDLSAVGQFALDVPAITMPSVSKITPSVALDWYATTFSMPTLE